MRSTAYRLLSRPGRRFVSDIKTDSYLKYILVLAAVLTGFWFWHLIPNFATRDEHARLLDVLPAIGALVVDPGIESLQRGVTQGRMYGATFYLNALALLPAVLFAVATGSLDAFVPFYRPSQPAMLWFADTDLWYLWHDMPRWVWTSSLLILRFFNVVFAIGCVYLTYRIGVTIRDRTTGRLAGVLLTLTFGFVVTAHEGGEDIPMVFFFLLVIYLAHRYLETGNETDLLAGCAIGGVAIAFKLTAVVGVVALGAAYLLRAHKTGTGWLRALLRPRLIGTGLLLGIGAIIIGYPSILLSGPDALAHRILRGTTNKGSVTGGRVASSWWWFFRGYLNGLGLPMFLVAGGSVLASIPKLRLQPQPQSHSQTQPQSQPPQQLQPQSQPPQQLQPQSQRSQSQRLSQRSQSQRSQSQTQPQTRSSGTDGIAVILIVFAGCVFMLSWWEYIRVHHLLPTFPLIALLVSAALLRLRDRAPLVGRSLIVILLVLSGAYTGYGDLSYATQSRAETTQWLNAHASDNATIEVYVMDPQDGAVPHGMHTSHYGHRNDNGERFTRNYTRTEWMLNMPSRCPEYIELTREDLRPLASNSQNARSRNPTKRAEYIRNLLTDNTDSYEIAAEFGPRPRFLEAPTQSQQLFPELLRVGVIPRTIQYGDEQDLGPEQYTIILKRAGRCARQPVLQPNA